MLDIVTVWQRRRVLANLFRCREALSTALHLYLGAVLSNGRRAMPDGKSLVTPDLAYSNLTRYYHQGQSMTVHA